MLNGKKKTDEAQNRWGRNSGEDVGKVPLHFTDGVLEERASITSSSVQLSGHTCILEPFLSSVVGFFEEGYVCFKGLGRGIELAVVYVH